ncbi:MAG: DNA replication and repair protein RecF [Lentisphaeria bacterium]|nr:DNA replication and repair protein RecF [Lentisphaeria bacterium]
MGTLSRLELRNFRNVIQEDISFFPGINLFLGANGQGKTNLLEAVCYLAFLRSFRTHGWRELRRRGSDTMQLHGRFTHPDPAFRFELGVSQAERRSLVVNATPVDRASEFIHRFLCVPLVPEDRSIIKGAAAERRRFLDIAASQVHSAHVLHLQRYREALRQRNALLRQWTDAAARVCAAYDAVLVRSGAQVEWCRRSYVGELAAALAETSVRIGGPSSAPCSIEYCCPGVPREQPRQEVDALETILERALARSADRDRREGHTCVGPHRAELVVSMGGCLLSSYGSEGECRRAALALRLSCLKVLQDRRTTGRETVVLVDDVVGELDRTRRGLFFEAVLGADQVLVAATDTPVELRDVAAHVYSVESGTVRCA